jgi:hypothetical protein
MGKVSRLARLVSLVALAGLLAGGGAPPPPEPCGRVSDQPEFVFLVYTQDFGTSFPLDEADCEKLVANGTAACHKAVSDCAACLDRLVGNMLKGGKVVCNSVSKVPSDCVDEAKGVAENRRAGVEDDAAEAHAICDGPFAAELADVCNGAPL